MGGDLTYGFPKPSRVARMNEKGDRRREREREEKAAKAESRRRDGNRCRFPLCGCQRKHRRLESAHVVDKSRGGPNKAANLITLCVDRHQDSSVSLHRGTLEIVAKDERGTDGPVAFFVDYDEACWYGVVPAAMRDRQVCLARESAIGVLEPIDDWQRVILDEIGRMLA